ncbi:MAG: ROK family protein [Anaerolineae bacterium]|nr:ROK family protein [Anaerolineae bacterium]
MNQFSVLALIREQGPVTCAQIAEQVPLGLPEISQTVANWVAAGWVIAKELPAASDPYSAMEFAFNGSGRLVLGVDLGGTKLYGAVATMDGNILYEIQVTHGQSTAEGSFTALCEGIDVLLAQAQTCGLPISGIGVGVPGVVDAEAGTVSFAPALGWQSFPLRERLVERYQTLVVVENDVNLAALGEFLFGLEPPVQSMVLLAIGTGIGAGIILNGAVFSGSHHVAGEVGYFLPEPSYLGRDYPGFGALEQLASGSGIADRARETLADVLSEDELARLTAADVFAAVRNGATWAIAIRDETADYLALLIHAMMLCLDPDCLVLSGGVAAAADVLLEPLQQRLEPALLTKLDVRVSKLGPRASILGSVAQLLKTAAI